jgi:hypothetical protein
VLATRQTDIMADAGLDRHAQFDALPHLSRGDAVVTLQTMMIQEDGWSQKDTHPIMSAMSLPMHMEWPPIVTFTQLSARNVFASLSVVNGTVISPSWVGIVVKRLATS